MTDASGHKDILYKVKIGGTDKELFLEDVAEMQISDGWIYYVNSENFGLYRIKTDGSSNTRLTEDDAEIWVYSYGYFKVHNDAIEYMDSNFDRFLLNKDGNTKIEEKDVQTVTDVYDGYIYFYSGNPYKLCRKKFGTDEVEEVTTLTGDYIIRVNVVNKYILYKKKDNNLYRVEWK